MADPGVDPHGAKELPFGLDLILGSTDDRLNGTTLSTKKTASVAHLSMP